MTKVYVWYKLDGESPGKVKVKGGADVADLKDAIKARRTNDLANVDATWVEVFAAGADPNTSTPLEPYETVPSDTTGRNPLVVVVPQQKQQLDEAYKLRLERCLGKHYSSINKVWIGDRQPFTGRFESLCRTRGYNGVPTYTRVLADADAVGRSSKAVDLKSESKANTETQESLNFDIFGNGPASRAHCIPADELCSASYGILAQAVVGAPDIEQQQDRDKAITALRTLIYGLKEGDNAGWGLKNLPSNIVVLPDPHKEHFDESGDWLIVPIMELKGNDGVKAWTDGKEYYALVIAGSNKGGPGLADKCEETYYFRLLRGSDYEEKPFLEKCNEDDILKATDLLRCFVLGVADVLDREGTKHQIAPSDLLKSKKQSDERDSEPVSQKKKFMKNAKEALLANGKVAVPALKQADLSKYVLMKVRIRKLPGVDAITDPMLLALKAAVQWSQRQNEFGLKLLPSCGRPKLEEDEADVLAREAYRELSLRSSTDPRFATLQSEDDQSPMLTRFIASPP